MATRRSRIKAVANLPTRRSRPTPGIDVIKEEPDSIKHDGDNISPCEQISQEKSLNDCLSSSSDTCDNQPKKCSVKEIQNQTSDVQGKSSQANDSHFLNDTSVEICLQSKVSEDQYQCKDDVMSEIPPSLPDRKSVIVSATEKDRKSVIVNRDGGNSCLVAKVSLGEEGDCGGSECQKLNEESHENQTSDVLNAPTTSTIIEDSVSPLKTSSTSAASSNKRLPIRGRRSKPTVNLVAAARKRSANDSSLSSPCSPPPCKFRGAEVSLRKASESDNDTEVPPAVKHIDKVQQSETFESTEKAISIKNIQSATPMSPKCPLPVAVDLPTSGAASTKEVANTNISSKIPISPISKTTDSSSGTTQEAASPQKESQNARRKQSSSAQRIAAARKNLKSKFSSEEAPPRSALTMFDLIFYNPSKNALKSSETTSSKGRRRVASVSSVSSIHEDRLIEESVDDLDGEKDKDDASEETAMPVPRVKIGPDGNLILDEQSLVIETTGTKKSREELERSAAITDTGFGHYKKVQRSKDWSDHETKKFYRALNVVGTDFSLMKPYFRKRSRRELKLKFKKEERLFPNLINKALAQPLDFDITELEKECALEDEEEKRQEDLAKGKASNSSDVDVQVKQEGVKKVVKKAVKKKGPKKGVLLAEIGIEVNTDGPTPKRSKPKGIPKNRKKVPEVEADYSSLANGLEIVPEKSKEKRKPKRERAKTVQKADQEPKNNVQEQTCKSKPIKRIRKKAAPKPASEPTDVPAVSETNSILQSKLSSSPPTSGSVTTPSVKVVPSSKPSEICTVQVDSQASTTQVHTVQSPSQTPFSQIRVAQSPQTPLSQIRVLQSSPQAPLTQIRIAQSSSLPPLSQIRVVPSTPQTPRSQIRILQSPVQGSQPLPAFGTATPINRLLPSTPLPRMEPGSIIVLKTPVPQNPDRHVLQVYMVTNTPPGSNTVSVPHSPSVPGINVLQGPAAQPATPKTPLSPDCSDSPKVLTKL